MSDNLQGVKIGWGEANITPERNVILAGQFHARVSEGVRDPVTASVLVVEGSRSDPASQLLLVSCDLASIGNELRDEVRKKVHALEKGIDPQRILIGATHTHTAPDARIIPYGMEMCGAEYKAMVKGTAGKGGKDDRFGMWPDIGLDAMSPADYLEFASDRIAEAVLHAWTQRKPGGIAYGLSPAVIGRNRRLVFQDGTSVMYGKAQSTEFRHVEGYEDHFVYALMTYDLQKCLTGMVVNVPCPSQVSEHEFLISADYWHETREELRRRFGSSLFVLGQCAPAGDQSPHVLVGRRAEERMWRLKGRLNENAPRAEIAERIANAIGDMLPYVEQEIDWNPDCRHHVEILPLPRRLISEADVAEALEEAKPFRCDYEQRMAALQTHPEIREQPRWYLEITQAYRRKERGERVKQRLELQRRTPMLSVEVHVARLGDVAFASNPFELYVDYAIRIRELSPAIQTFLIQKSGCNGTYLPSARSVAGKGYGSVPASTDIGPDGGDALVDWTVSAIKALFS